MHTSSGPTATGFTPSSNSAIVRVVTVSSAPR